MNPLYLILSGVLGGLGVAFGAFGAHALRDRLSEDKQVTFETGVRYQMYHALALFLVALATGAAPGSIWIQLAGWLFVAGILLFSGSLYLLVSTGKRWFGVVTPFGGLAFIAGWACLVVFALST